MHASQAKDVNRNGCRQLSQLTCACVDCIPCSLKDAENLQMPQVTSRKHCLDWDCLLMYVPDRERTDTIAQAEANACDGQNLY